MNKKDYLKIISSSLHNTEKKVFFYLNTHSFYLLKTNEEFKKYFNKADFITPDGYSIKWAIKFLYKQQIEKVSFNHHFFQNIRNLFAENTYRIFLLGGKSQELEAAVKNFINLSPKLNIVGQNHGYFDKQNESEEIILKINSVQPDVLLVGIGMTESVEWIIKNKESINAKLIFTVGNLFDIIAGEKRLAPKYLYNTPFEWIYRLIQEPIKLTKRYLICHSHFLYNVIKAKIGF